MKNEINQRTPEHKHTEEAFLIYNHKELHSHNPKTHFQHYHIHRHVYQKLEVISFPQWKMKLSGTKQNENLKKI